MRKSVARGTALVRAHSLLAVALRSDDISRLSGLNCMASLERRFVVEHKEQYGAPKKDRKKESLKKFG